MAALSRDPFIASLLSRPQLSAYKFITNYNRGSPRRFFKNRYFLPRSCNYIFEVYWYEELINDHKNLQVIIESPNINYSKKSLFYFVIGISYLGISMCQEIDDVIDLKTKKANKSIIDFGLRHLYYSSSLLRTFYTSRMTLVTIYTK